MNDKIADRAVVSHAIETPEPNRSAADKLEKNVLAKQLTDHCAFFQGADTKRSIIQLVTTLTPFVFLSVAALIAFNYVPWLGIALAVPASGLLVRLFIIQHDCGHQSFFKSRKVNDLVGRLISLITLTPYGFWRNMHAIHHATSGNLDRRGFGDVMTLTVQEYKALPRLKRFGYRLYRNPIVLFLIGAPYHFIIGQRIPWGQPHPFKKVWRSIVSLDLAIMAIYGVAAALLGWEPALGALAIFVLASWIGGWLFFVQHQFEDTYWAAEEEGWDFHTAAVLGSSYYHLPRILQWFTGNIGFHHIHHLCGKIPNYRLQECFDGSPLLQKASRITLFESLKCARLALWDEDTSKLVRFKHLKAA